MSVQNVKKRIGNKEIIKGISFEVYGGEIFGFLGPNGSGKTTTIRMLVGLIKPTSGRVEMCGYDVEKHHNEALAHVGCIVENPEMYPYLTGWENLEHFARMLDDVGEDRIQEVVNTVGMDARIHDKVKTYSLGMRQRLGIAQALLGRPKLLILDEPTNGLDPQGIKEMRHFIRKLAEGGLSLFVSSHLLSEIQQMCDRVAIISHGEVMQVGKVEDLIAAAGSRVIWKVAPIDQAIAIIEQDESIQVFQSTNAQSESHFVSPVDPQELVTAMNTEDVAGLNAKFIQAGVQVFAIETRNPTLEDLFLSVTEGGSIE
ncbi:ABC transporter ATP-binding protein [Paenibacillus sp. N1-5-1-14]|uniref:ABC transporter ATP-binding protein n=1 Tax=Paenibacillus radicibacter TaxID=2972488 RepID=UPI002159A316|nr:ABC transporter ATP-binding protein [Paenibacillus radicibacter]MCR8641683.1 ABC transporter ATP-binding protein [Paenibacillus radicibacter]